MLYSSELYYYHCVCVCVLLAFITKQSGGKTSLEINISEQNEAYGIIEGPVDQSSIEMSQNITYSTVEQQQIITPPIYETIN